MALGKIFEGLRQYLFGAIFILTINLLYFHFFDIVWLSWKSFAGFLNCFSYQFALYVLILNVHRKTAGIFLVILTVCYSISSFGKYNWGEIPNYLLLKNTVLSDTAILGKFRGESIAVVLLLSIVLSIIFALNEFFQKKYYQKFKYQNILLFGLGAVSVVCITFIYIRNQNALWFYKRDILGQDPFMGIFIKNSKYSGDRPINHTSIVDYKAGFLQKRSFDSTNVIIIVSDALRPDHMSLFGYERKTTKFLDSLKLIEKNMQVSMFSTSSCTSSFCGITSLLYGRNFEKIPLNKMGIHDILKLHGYSTSFLLAGCHKCFYGLGDFYGVNIDNYFETRFNRDLDKDISIYDDLGIVKYLNTLQFNPSKPAFMYIHIMAPHLGSVLSKTNKGPFFNINTQYDELVTEYDNGVVQSDFILNELLRVLKSKGVYDNSLIFITSDHGEGLKQNHLFKYSGHGHIPYDEGLNIPLIIIDPKNNNYNLEYTTQTDIVPTIIDRIFKNYNSISKVFDGQSLLSNKNITRYTYHLFKIRNSPIPSLAIIKQVNNRPVSKYLYDSHQDKRYLFDLTETNYDKYIINDSFQMKEFISLHNNYIKETFSIEKK